MHIIVIGLCLVLVACCPKFVKYQSVDVESIKATLPPGTPLPVEIGVGKVKIDPQRDASQEIQKLFCTMSSFWIS
jgi:hypothetical protein